MKICFCRSDSPMDMKLWKICILLWKLCNRKKNCSSKMFFFCKTTEEVLKVVEKWKFIVQTLGRNFHLYEIVCCSLGKNSFLFCSEDIDWLVLLPFKVSLHILSSEIVLCLQTRCEDENGVRRKTVRCFIRSSTKRFSFVIEHIETIDSFIRRRSISFRWKFFILKRIDEDKNLCQLVE